MLSQVDGKAESLEEGICLVPSKPLPVGESEFALLFPRGRSHDSGYGGGGALMLLVDALGLELRRQACWLLYRPAHGHHDPPKPKASTCCQGEPRAERRFQPGAVSGWHVVYLVLTQPVPIFKGSLLIGLGPLW